MCVGKALAQAEADALLGEIVRRVARIEPAGEARAVDDNHRPRPHPRARAPRRGLRRCRTPTRSMPSITAITTARRTRISSAAIRTTMATCRSIISCGPSWAKAAPSCSTPALRHDMAQKRGRELVRPVADGLKAIGIEPTSVRDVIISHMHYDHAGNIPLVPECALSYPGRRDGIRHRPVDVPHRAARRLRGRARRHRWCIACSRTGSRFTTARRNSRPASRCTSVGGHTKGLQVTRVRTRRGWVVLASDAAHLYANMERNHPSPSCSTSTIIWKRFAPSATSRVPRRISCPGTTPWCSNVIRRAKDGLAGIVRLDAEPKG